MIIIVCNRRGKNPDFLFISLPNNVCDATGKKSLVDYQMQI